MVLHHRHPSQLSQGIRHSIPLRLLRSARRQRESEDQSHHPEVPNPKPRFFHLRNVRSGRFVQVRQRVEGVRDLHDEPARHLRASLPARVLLRGVRQHAAATIRQVSRVSQAHHGAGVLDGEPRLLERAEGRRWEQECGDAVFVACLFVTHPFQFDTLSHPFQYLFPTDKSSDRLKETRQLRRRHRIKPPTTTPITKENAPRRHHAPDFFSFALSSTQMSLALTTASSAHG